MVSFWAGPHAVCPNAEIEQITTYSESVVKITAAVSLCCNTMITPGLFNFPYDGALLRHETSKCLLALSSSQRDIKHQTLGLVHIPIFTMNLDQVVSSCSAGTKRWMFTLKQNIYLSSLFPPHVPPLLTDCCSAELASGFVVHRWHQPMMESPGGGVWTGSPVRLHHVATATANITPCHKVLHMRGILLWQRTRGAGA